jgi:hypothetical protein
MTNLDIFVLTLLDEVEKTAMMGIQKNPNPVMGGNIKIKAPGPPKPLPTNLPSATAPKLPASQVIGTSVAQKRITLPTNIVGGK